MYNVTIAMPLEKVSHDFRTKREAFRYRKHLQSIRPHLYVDHHHAPDSDFNGDILVLVSEDKVEWMIITVKEEKF